MYFWQRITSSVSLALAYRLLLVTHDAVVSNYSLARGTYVAHGDTAASFLAAFVRAVGMSSTEYATARAAYDGMHRDVDAANLEALRIVLEDP